MNILLEQVVYGSFRFWDRGYDVLARSPGCQDNWLTDVLAACRQFGEAPSGVTPASSLFATRLKSGPWAVVGVEPQGEDDRGRPGALAFHALIVSPADYRKLGSNPFALAIAIRRDWSAEMTTLPALAWPVGPRGSIDAANDPRSVRVAHAMARGKRVAIESDRPLGPLAVEVWRMLPESRRRRSSVATWAFGNANRFDLVALPRLSIASLDSSYVDLSLIDHEGPTSTHKVLPLRQWSRPLLILSAIALAMALATGGVLAWWPSGRPTDLGEPQINAEEANQVAIDLKSLADMFDQFEVGDLRGPSEIMARFSSLVRYRGATLTSSDLAGLAEESDPDRDVVLAWHEKIGTFLDDRPLPPNFDRLPLRQQLEAFAGSFHLVPSSRAEEVPGTLARTLARAGAIRPTPLASRYPALSEYARFLARLPRRTGQ